MNRKCKLKRTVFYIESQSNLYIYVGQNVYVLNALNNDQLNMINIIKYLWIQKGDYLYNVMKYLDIEELLLKKYLVDLDMCIEIYEIKPLILLIGETKLIDMLIDIFDVYCVAYQYIKSNEVISEKHFNNADLVILSQNLDISPYYRIINKICREKNISIVNIIFDRKTYMVSAIRNHGIEICFECLIKRFRINCINYFSLGLIEEFESKMLDYDDSSFFVVMDWLPAYKMALKIYELFIDKVYIPDNLLNKIICFIYQGEILIEETESPLLPIPECENLCNQIYLQSASVNKIKKSETYLINRSFINDKVGLFRKLLEVVTELEGNQVYYYTVQIPNIYNAINNRMCTTHYECSIAGGVSVRKDIALGKAIGEACERYCLGSYNFKKFKKASCNELEREEIAFLKQGGLFADWQYKVKNFCYKAYTKDIEIVWTSTLDFFKNIEVMIPASYIYSHYFDNEDGNCIGRLTTSGASCSTEYKDAILYGILELIERDCTMITWLQKLPVAKVLVDVNKIDNPILKGLYELIQQNNIVLDIFYITLDLKLPCFLAIGSSSSPTLPAKLIGAGCRLSKQDALIRALEEIIQGCGWSKLNSKIKNFKIQKGFGNVNNFIDRVCLYAHKEMEKEFDFLIKSQNRISFDEIYSVYTKNKIELNICIDILKKNNMNIFVKDITTPEIRVLGFVVVKVYIPELQQIEADHRYRYLGNDRVYKAPEKLGYKNLIYNSKLFNSAPHPFP